MNEGERRLDGDGVFLITIGREDFHKGMQLGRR